MNIYVKLTGETTETLRNVLGVNGGVLDLAKGLIRLNDKAAVAVLAEKQMIANVNNQTYEEFLKTVAEAEKTAGNQAETDEAPVVELTAEERNKIIGWKADIGSIVRINAGKETEHVVILDVEDENYTVATLRLKPGGITSTGSVTLKKGVDVLYKNPTYKDKVTVTKEITYGLTADQFKKGSGGMIVGRVIKMEKLQDLVDFATNPDEPETGEEVKA